MIVAAIETSTAVGSVALVRDGEVLREVFFEKGVRHGREVIPRLRDALAEIGLGPRAVDLYAVGTGPGSYTGLRVGVMTAKALAYATERAVLGVSSFDALAASVPADLARGAVALLIATDARRDHVYRGVYALDGDACGTLVRRRRLADLDVVAPGAVLAAVPRPVLVLGDAPALYPEAFAGLGVRLGPAAAAVPPAGAVARLAALAYSEGARQTIHEVAPLYLRPSLPEERAAGTAD